MKRVFVVPSWFSRSVVWKLLGILAIATTGTYLLTKSYAAATAISYEPETTTVSSPASVVNDGDASGGSALKFQAALAGTNCDLPKYPNPSCAGVPAGTTFSNTVNGTYTVTTAGQTIEGWHITGDLHIIANNTVVKNSQIDGTVNNQGGGENYYSFTITDSTIGPPSACTRTSPASCQNGKNSIGCIVAPGVGESNYTATRVYVRGHDDGFRLSGAGNATVKDSYFYACYLDETFSPPDGSHSDGIQAVCDATCAGFNILHTTLDLSGVPATFPLNLMETHLTNVTANDNMLLGGGNYLVSALWTSGPNWIFHNNRFVKDTWWANKPWPQTIGIASSDDTCNHQDWQGNTVVTIDEDYAITGTNGALSCIN